MLTAQRRPPRGAWIAAALLLTFAPALHAQQTTRVAIVPLVAYSAQAVPTADMTRHLQEELTGPGGYTAVLVQAPGGACAARECALEAAKTAGASLAVFGQVTELDAQNWLLSATLISVPSGAVVRSISVTATGSPSTRFPEAVASLANRLGAVAGAAVERAQAQAAAQREYEGELGSWRKKWIFSLTLAALVAAGSQAEANQVSDANAKEKRLASQAANTSSTAQWNGVRQQISDTAKSSQQAADMSNGLATVAALLGIYGGYQLFFNKPHAPAAVAFEILPAPEHGGLTVALSIGF